MHRSCLWAQPSTTNLSENFQNYNRLVADAVKEFADKEVEIEFEPLSEDAFGKLMASNEWTMEQTVEIGMLIVG